MLTPNKFFSPALLLLGSGLLLSLSGCGNSSSAATAAAVPVVPVTPVPPPPGVDPLVGRNRYAFNNTCVALRDNSSGKYVTSSGSGYAASATAVGMAEPFRMKPTLLGEYALLNRAGTLLNAAATVGNVAIASATDTASLRLLANGDSTRYPVAPQYDVPTTKAAIDSYRAFTDPLINARVFTLSNAGSGQRLTGNGSGALTMSSSDTPSQRFLLEEVTGCGVFPEAHDNTVGETFKGTTSDGRVLGMADVHVHTSSSSFLGGALSGKVFHKFAALQALADCAPVHGPMGSMDALSAAYEGDTNGHATDGWPTFSEWPNRNSLTHRAIYWKWIERAWKGGLRIMVNDLVENASLCTLERKAKGEPNRDCNEMNSARRQVGTMYAMQDYIDAQFGGPGKGYFQIVHTPAEARTKIADGKLAVILGMEISNLFNCQPTYNPARTKQPFEEPGSGATETKYGCAMTETGAPNEVKTQLEELMGYGVRQIISIHEFDNAFGGNGIFNDMILNLGNKDNSGGIPDGTPNNPFGSSQTPTGEFWTTYDCPVEGATPAASTPGFTGYLWGNSGGAVLKNFGPPAPAPCPFTGQNGRPGGTTGCYPAAVRQCNARWLTPIGLYTYKKMMENGIIFDLDHLEMAMKTQVLEVAEAQNPVYPFVSTHGTFGGMSIDQASRVLKNGGLLYPSLGSVKGFLDDMKETRGVSGGAGNTHLFGFGFGTDTDGLSGQEGPRRSIAAGKEVKYPFILFTGAPFDQLPDFAGKTGVVFNQPEERDAGGKGRTWSQDKDGNAHYGMMADFVEEMRQEGSPQDMQTLFNAAEVYLQTWERTLAAADGIQKKGIVTPAGVLRAAPKPGEVSTYK